MKYLFLSLAILSILSQVPHAYWSIERYSRIKQTWLRDLQIWVFCGIISIGIFAYVLIGNHRAALIGAAVEILINLYYYNNQFSNIQQPIRKHWLAYFLAFLIPLSIYFFTKTYSEL